MKIQNRLLLSILPVVFIIVITVTSVSIYTSKNSLEKQAKDNAQLLSRSYSNQLDARVTQLQKMSRDLSAAIVTAVNAETVLIDARKRYPEIILGLYLSLDGTIKDMAPYNRALLNENYSGSLEWHESIKTLKPTVSNPKKYLGHEVIFVYSPVIIDYVVNKKPEVTGMTILIIPVDYIFNTFKDVVFGKTGSLFVINEQGKFIFHKNESYILNRSFKDLTNSTDLTEIQNAMTSLKSGFGTYFVGNRKDIISFAGIPSAHWSLAISGSYKEFTETINTIMKVSIIILILSLLIATYVIYYIVHGVTMPLTTLTDIADRITKGDITLRSRLKTKNEVGQLSRTFDIMVDQLENHNKILEYEVESRTEELQVINEELKTTNEILDSNAREIESMNEELKVTNETLDFNAREMEAMNEELKVSNESLEEVNMKLSNTVDELEKTKNALWSEMELAQKLQSVLLPEEPKITGFDISAFMATTSSVGGDYYDVINVDGLDWFLIGDVSGHGVTAGLIMMMVQTSIHVALSQNPISDPVNLLSVINKIIHSNISKLGGNRYVTLTVFACLSDNKFSFAGAHLPVIIYRKQSNSIEMMETPGTWVGLIEDISGLNNTNEFIMHKDDILLLYTDGISEAITKTGKPFTQNALAEILLEHSDLDAKGICSKIKEYSEELTVDDDVTIMTLKKV